MIHRFLKYFANLSRWLDKDWWKYLFAPRSYTAQSYGTSWYRIIQCRYRGHPNGPVWYSDRWEPNWDCKDCSDDLG